MPFSMTTTFHPLGSNYRHEASVLDGLDRHIHLASLVFVVCENIVNEHFHRGGIRPIMSW